MRETIVHTIGISYSSGVITDSKYGFSSSLTEDTPDSQFCMKYAARKMTTSGAASRRTCSAMWFVKISPCQLSALPSAFRKIQYHINNPISKIDSPSQPRNPPPH